MDWIYQFLNLVVLLVILGFFWSFKGYFCKIGEEMAKNTAANINFVNEIRKIVATEEAKAIILRLDTTKAEGAMKLNGLMAEIESILINWQLTAYFHMDELKENDTIEDLGTKDLKRISQNLVQLSKEANEYSILLGNEVLTDIILWSNKIHALIFESEAVYKASKKINEAKPKDDNCRVTTINDLMASQVAPKIKDIGLIRTQISKKLSENVRKTLFEATKL